MSETDFDFNDRDTAEWFSRRFEHDHAGNDKGVCVDRRCDEFRRVYPWAFQQAWKHAVSVGASFNADDVRRIAKTRVPGLQPCHVNGIGRYWGVWRREGLIRPVGAVRSRAAGSNRTLNYSYMPCTDDVVPLTA